jgi:hypothetical protein
MERTVAASYLKVIFVIFNPWLSDSPPPPTLPKWQFSFGEVVNLIFHTKSAKLPLKVFFYKNDLLSSNDS